MGERGAANEPATAADIEAMAAIVERGLRAGALGFSTSRTPIHRSKSGELVPGTNADGRRAVRDRRCAAPRRARRVPVRARPRRRADRRVAVDARARPPDRPHGERQPEPARTARPTCGATCSACSTTPPPTASRSSPRSPGESVGLLMCLEGSFNPLAFHPAFRSIRRPAARRAGGGAALARPAAGVGDRAGRRRAVPQGRARQARSVVGGGRRRHRLRARRRRLDRRGRPPDRRAIRSAWSSTSCSPTTGTA